MMSLTSTQTSRCEAALMLNVGFTSIRVTVMFWIQVNGMTWIQVNGVTRIDCLG
jgi:hypothetical protein